MNVHLRHVIYLISARQIHVSRLKTDIIIVTSLVWQCVNLRFCLYNFKLGLKFPSIHSIVILSRCPLPYRTPNFCLVQHTLSLAIVISNFKAFVGLMNVLIVWQKKYYVSSKQKIDKKHKIWHTLTCKLIQRKENTQGFSIFRKLRKIRPVSNIRQTRQSPCLSWSGRYLT